MGRGGRDNPFFFEILYYFYRILILDSWHVSRPPHSEISGSAPANVCNNVRRKVDNATNNNLPSGVTRLREKLKKDSSGVGNW